MVQGSGSVVLDHPDPPALHLLADREPDAGGVLNLPLQGIHVLALYSSRGHAGTSITRACPVSIQRSHTAASMGAVLCRAVRVSARIFFSTAWGLFPYFFHLLFRLVFTPWGQGVLVRLRGCQVLTSAFAVHCLHQAGGGI
jgi:hypothetical protein